MPRQLPTILATACWFVADCCPSSMDGFPKRCLCTKSGDISAVDVCLSHGRRAAGGARVCLPGIRG